ncbi:MULTISPECIES: PilZ domain-containing protein [Marinobacter]|uniref:PilZ domain-containing protein n=1 Tax=Marinobacter xiaoshiensis TaxID=3073652 RepID=A0ABU2HHE8_9GAMM|nr:MULTISPECIES: PilZ domain-containing protein [unclassified Marinobacter]MBK1886025.1 PilZ domain-containing protein [Marinobacter sp. DY40_1A1]MDS1310472.1 PilZ domain-containing protein [Marinobacter sp. F60267]
MKDTDYTFGTEEDPAGGQDNRKQYRLTARAQITLELEAGYPASEGIPGSSRREMACAVRDISVSGLCLLSEECLSAGALYPVSVSLGDHEEPFVLTVEVVWSRPEKAGYLVGMRIVESAQTAYVEWTEAVASAMEAS